MDNDQQRAVEALTQSEKYISLTACDKMVQSIVSDFDWVLSTAVFRLIISKMEDPEQFLSTVKSTWQERAKNILSNDYKRFQETIIKATVKDNKLSDNFASVQQNYKQTIDMAYEKSENIIDSMIEALTPTKKEN